VDGPLTARKEEPRQPSWSSATGRGSTRPRSGTSSLASPSRVRARQCRDARSDLWAASWSHPTVWPCSCSRDRRRHSWTKKARGRRSRSIASWRRCVSNLPTRGRDGFASHMGSGHDSAVVGKVMRISLRRAENEANLRARQLGRAQVHGMVCARPRLTDLSACRCLADLVGDRRHAPVGRRSVSGPLPRPWARRPGYSWPLQAVEVGQGVGKVFQADVRPGDTPVMCR
jgi:hypothetical protein